MKKQLFFLSSLCLFLAACENMSMPKADNTARNARDRSGETLTPGDQGENETDRTLTQKIRQTLMDDNALSINAKNVKIITSNGVVTLRGVVNSDREKHEIGKKAKAVASVRSVDNQLEVVQSDNTINTISPSTNTMSPPNIMNPDNRVGDRRASESYEDNR